MECARINRNEQKLLVNLDAWKKLGNGMVKMIKGIIDRSGSV